MAQPTIQDQNGHTNNTNPSQITSPTQQRITKKRKKGRSKGSKVPFKGGRGHGSYGNNPRYGQHGMSHNTNRASISHAPHHQTVKSLASINAPIMVEKLTKMSTDLKFQRELKKALMELKQKDDDYRYAIEIGEQLTQENTYLKEQMENLASHIQAQQSDNRFLKEKMSTMAQTYKEDLYRYHAELEESKEMVERLQQILSEKQQEIHDYHTHTQLPHSNGNKQSGNGNGGNLGRMSSDDYNSLSDNHLKSGLEKKLYAQVASEKKKYEKQQQTIDSLIAKVEDMMYQKKAFDKLKNEYKAMKQIAKERIEEEMQAQKSIESEVILLTARTANLEEEREDLINLLDQKDYEITMLNQQIILQQNSAQRKRHNAHSSNHTSDHGDSLMNMATMTEEQDEFDDSNNDYEDDDAEVDDMAMITDILDNDDFFHMDNEDEHMDNEDNDDTEGVSNNTKVESNKAMKTAVPAILKEKSKGKEERVFDKIKEYLHLTASAVKIKYPTVKEVQSDELIKRVEGLPFYKFHDSMVRIMDVQLKKIKEKERNLRKLTAHNNVVVGSDNNNNVSSDDGPRPMLKKRKSFLSIFNLFGSKEDASDTEYDEKDNGNSNNNNNSGDLRVKRKLRSHHSTGNLERTSASSNAQRRSKKRYNKQSGNGSGYMSDDGFSDSDVSGQSHSMSQRVRSGSHSKSKKTSSERGFRRGASVQANQKRLKF